MINEEFLKDVCPNHTEKSKWNRSELLHILDMHKKQLSIQRVSNRRELLIDFCSKVEETLEMYGHLAPNEAYIDEYLKGN